MGEQVIEFLAQKKKALLNTVEHIKAEDFLEIDEKDLVNSLVDKFKVEAPIIDFESVWVSNYEKYIPAELFHPSFNVHQGKSYPKQVAVYHLPFTGDGELFQYTPSQFMLWSPEVYIEEQNVCFEIINFYRDTEELKKEAQRSIDAIKFFSDALLQDVGSYNVQLRDNVEQLVKARKQKLLDDSSLLTALGKPINKKHFTFGLGRVPLFVETKAATVKDQRNEKEKVEEIRAEEVNQPSHETDTNKSSRRLRVFLCHSSGDKPHVRNLYSRLIAEGIDAWLDEESLLAGQDWELEISRAIRNTDVVIVCLSQHSTTKKGYVQKEIKFALDEADKQPEGTIFIIPVRVESCDLPDRLRRYHTVNIFEERGFEKLMRALRSRSDELGLTLTSTEQVNQETMKRESQRNVESIFEAHLMAKQQEADKTEPESRLTLLRRENAQNLKILDDFWRQVTDSLKDYPLHAEIQKYHRLAYNYLAPWHHLIWEKQTLQLPLIDEKVSSRMYELNQSLDTFVALRKKIQGVFDTDENTKFWNDFIAWMKAYYEGNLKQRDEAQHGPVGEELDRKAIQFSNSLTPYWNEINSLYQSIHNLGNPIP
jgi:hypothetical protein